MAAPALTAAAAVDWDTGTCVGEEGDYPLYPASSSLGTGREDRGHFSLSLAHSSDCRTADKAMADNSEYNPNVADIFVSISIIRRFNLLVSINEG